MYETQEPINISSLLPISTLTGGFCSRALTSFNVILEITKTENININKNIDSVLNIFSFFSFIKNFTSERLK